VRKNLNEFTSLSSSYRSNFSYWYIDTRMELLILRNYLRSIVIALRHEISFVRVWEFRGSHESTIFINLYFLVFSLLVAYKVPESVMPIVTIGNYCPISIKQSASVHPLLVTMPFWHVTKKKPDVNQYCHIAYMVTKSC
jgi:hypothetical protein